MITAESNGRTPMVNAASRGQDGGEEASALVANRRQGKVRHALVGRGQPKHSPAGC